MGTRRTIDWLRDPAGDDVERAAFRRYARALTLAWWPRLGWLVGGACLVWWPTDAVVFRDSAGAVAAMGWLRLRLAVMDVALAVAAPHLPGIRTYTHAWVAAAALLNLAVAGVCLPALDVPGLSGISYAFVAPVFSMLLVVDLRWRLLAAAAMSGTVMAGWWWAATPSLRASTGALTTGSFLVFMTLLSAFLGHASFAFLRRAFHLGRRVTRQRAELAALADGLERQVAEQTDALRLLHDRAATVRAVERAEIARDLHDDLGQELLSMRLLVGLGRQQEPAGGGASLDELDAQVQRIQLSLRRLLLALRPAGLADGVGLVEALRALAADLQRRSGVAITVTAASDVAEPPPEVAVALYRVAQEAVHNALRHGRARRVRVALEARAGDLVLQVRDDGVGVDPSRVGQGHGTEGITARARNLGGDATWRVEGGTVLQVRVPLGRAA